MDTYNRRLHMDFRKSLFNTLGTLDDLFKSAVVTAEHLYQNWYLSELNGSWNSLIKESVADGFSQNGILQQDDFYRRVVQPIARESRVFVIISDALRYEVATELTERHSITIRYAICLSEYHQFRHGSTTPPQSINDY